MSHMKIDIFLVWPMSWRAQGIKFWYLAFLLSVHLGVSTEMEGGLKLQRCLSIF